MLSTLIIAEAGVNYNGSLDLAKKMVYKAKEAGADIIKFQTSKPELVISRFAEKADYQKKTTGTDESQLDMVRKLILKYEDFAELKKLCGEVGIGFLSTPFDLDSVDYLHSIGMDIWKIPSGEITNLPYLEKIGGYNQQLILSTGMSTLQEVGEAIKILVKSGTEKQKIRLLHCTTEYPAPYEDVNLMAMQTMRDQFGLEVGYSDHTKGLEIPVAAVALGATIIEKHFTLDRNMEGPDQKASIEPDELAEMVRTIRHVEVAIGDGKKEPAQSEIKNMAIARKSIVAKVAIKKGETFTNENIYAKRPGHGMSPMLWRNVLGKKASRDYGEDELLDEEL